MFRNIFAFTTNLTLLELVFVFHIYLSGLFSMHVSDYFHKFSSILNGLSISFVVFNTRKFSNYILKSISFVFLIHFFMNRTLIKKKTQK